MQTQYVKLNDLRPADYNPRFMPAEEMANLKESILKDGFIEPIIINTRNDQESGDRSNVIISGHQRRLALLDLIAKGHDILNLQGKGADTAVPCVPLDLSLEDEKQLNIRMNRIKGKWDDEKLADILVGLRGSANLEVRTGMKTEEISRLLDTRLQPIEDALTEAESEAIEGQEPDSKPGTVYELGPHRLICGDCTDERVWQKLLDGQQADMVFTDPPYNVNYHSRGDNLKDTGTEKIANDNLDPEQFWNLIQLSFLRMAQHAKSGASFYICSGWSSYPTFLQAMEPQGIEHHGVIIWVKNVPSMGWNDYRYKHEWVLRGAKAAGAKEKKTAESIVYGWKKGTHQFHAQNEYDVWDMPRKATAHYLHPTEKPDWLAMRAIRNSTNRGDIVVDPFAGSGSTMAAAEKTGRRAFLIEMDPKFCDRIRARWDKLKTLTEKPSA